MQLAKSVESAEDNGKIDDNQIETNDATTKSSDKSRFDTAACFFVHLHSHMCIQYSKRYHPYQKELAQRQVLKQQRDLEIRVIASVLCFLLC